MFRSAWQVRHDFWQDLAPTLEPVERDRSVAALHRAYEADLNTAWHQRANESLKAILSLHPLVPEAEPIYRRWRRRTTLLRPAWRLGAWVFDRIPGALQMLLRPPRSGRPRAGG